MTRAKVLLKARPTPAQLADRLRSPWSDGVELYLDAADLSGEGWLERIRQTIAAFAVPLDFSYIVEGPITGLDGAFFDTTADTTVSRLLIDRLVAVGSALRAEAVNIHLVAPRPTAAFDDATKAATLERALPLLRQYVARCQDAGLTPLIENMPPVLRMRAGAFVYSAIGVETEEFLALAAELPGLRVTVDLSHAQLYVNALGDRPPAVAPDAPPEPEIGRLLAFLQRRPGPATLDEYVTALAPLIENVHVSNAAGLLGEGLPYNQGDAPLDRVVGLLIDRARFVVTETLEDDHNDARHMRAAQAAIGRLGARGRWAGASGQRPGTRVRAADRPSAAGGTAISFSRDELAALLPRPVHAIDWEPVWAPFRGKRVLVTGSGGSLGSDLVAALADAGIGALTLVEVHEPSLFHQQQRLRASRPDLPVRSVLADLRDRRKMAAVLEETEPDYLFHLAAYKHVPLAEENVDQVVEVNLLATLALAELAAEAGVAGFLYPSTDKAVRPPSIYGATKRLVELGLKAIAPECPATAVRLVRLVNVLGTQGGIIDLFARQLAAGQPLTITDPAMTRYYITREEAVYLLARTAGAPDLPVGPFLVDAGPALSVGELVRRVAARVRPEGEVLVRTIGARPGERQHEELLYPFEAWTPTGYPDLFQAVDPRPAMPVGELAERIEQLQVLLRRGDNATLRRTLFALTREEAAWIPS